jgi:hypothetical protein
MMMRHGTDEAFVPGHRATDGHSSKGSPARGAAGCWHDECATARRFTMIDEPEPRRDMSSEERRGATAAADAWNEF